MAFIILLFSNGFYRLTPFFAHCTIAGIDQFCPKMSCLFLLYGTDASLDMQIEGHFLVSKNTKKRTHSKIV